MKSVGFLISNKENEFRRALLPEDIKKIKNRHELYFEKSYGSVLGIDDEEYLQVGANVVSRDEVMEKDIICDPKIGDAEYLDNLHNQVVFGWIHAVQNKDITDKLVNNKLTGYAWEDMYKKNRHVFWRNNELAGEAAVMHAFQCYGKMPYNTKVALLGRGNVGNGALKILTLLGADVTVYSKPMEKLFQEELEKYDVVVNAILWDTSRKDHIIYQEDLHRMKKDSMIVDISCDRNGSIETSIPTTIENPMYRSNGVWHYVVDHTPSIFFKTSSMGISSEVCKYMDDLITETENEVLSKSLCVREGTIVDKRIIEFQGR